MISRYDSKNGKRFLISITPDEDITLSHGDETPIGSIGLIESSESGFRELYYCLKDMLDMGDDDE